MNTQLNLFSYDLPVLYARSKTGAVLVWKIEIVDNKYRTITGIENGQLVTSEWTVAKGKNIGKANETSDSEQAYADAVSKWKHKLKVGGYKEEKSKIDDVNTFIEPMLAHPLISKKRDAVTKELIIKDRTKFLRFPVMVDRKYNGMRQVCSVMGPFSRKGEPVVSAPHVYEILQPLFDKYPDLVLDGELYNHDLRYKLNELMSIVRTSKKITQELLNDSKDRVKYYVYDAYGFDNIKESTGCKDRRDALHVLLKNIPYIVPVPYFIAKTMAEARILYNGFISDGYEGAILRNSDAPYQHYRTNDLIKLKPFDDMEVKLIDIIDPGTGNWSGTGKIITCQLKNGSQFNATYKGSFAGGVELLKNKNKWIGKIITITYNGFTGKNLPNYAQFDPLNCDASDKLKIKK